MDLLVGSVRVAAGGPLDADAVWARYTAPAAWPGWAPHLRSVDYPHDVVRPGTAGRVTGVGGLVAVFRIDTVDEDERTWSWSVRSGPLRLRLEHGVQDDGATGSTAWVRVHGPRPVVLVYAPLARWSLGRLVTP